MKRWFLQLLLTRWEIAAAALGFYELGTRLNDSFLHESLLALNNYSVTKNVAGAKIHWGLSQTMLTRFYPLLTTYPPHLCRNSFTKMRENLHTVDISSSIHLSGLVNVVCECLLAQKNAGWPKVLFRQLIGFKNIAKIFIDCWTVHLKTESDPIFTPTPSTFWCLWWQFEKSTLFGSM